MKACPLVIELSTSKPVKQASITNLVPLLLENDQVTVLWQTTDHRNTTRNNLKRLLAEDVGMLGIDAIRFSDPESRTANMVESSATLNKERLDDPSVLVPLMMNYVTSTIDTKNKDDLPEAEWSNLSDCCEDAMERWRHFRNERLDTKQKIIAIACETAEFVFGKSLRNFAQTSMMRKDVHMLERKRDERVLRTLSSKFALESTHASPFSCTLTRDGICIEEYDAVVASNGSLMAFDVTCSPNPKGKFQKKVVLPDIHPDTHIVIVGVSRSVEKMKVQKDKSSKIMINLPIFQAVQKLGASIYEGIYGGNKQEFYATTREINF